jgi:hypothetical protein
MVEQDLLHDISWLFIRFQLLQTQLQRGDVCIFARKDQCFNKTVISHQCKEQDLEICAIQLIIISLYRAPSGD